MDCLTGWSHVRVEHVIREMGMSHPERAIHGHVAQPMKQRVELWTNAEEEKQERECDLQRQEGQHWSHIETITAAWHRMGLHRGMVSQQCISSRV